MFICHRLALPSHATDKLPARSLTRLVKAPSFGMTQQQGNIRMSKSRRFFVYIMANRPRSHVLYTGVTGNLPHRTFQHKNKLVPGFTSRYNLARLVYYEEFVYPDAAINREKEIIRMAAQQENTPDRSYESLLAGPRPVMDERVYARRNVTGSTRGNSFGPA